jgi:ankyrin repeat protein
MVFSIIGLISLQLNGCVFVSGNNTGLGTELYQVFNYGNFEQIKEYLDTGTDVNSLVLDIGSTHMKMPLLYISQSDRWYPNVATYLLEQGADPNFTDKKGRTLLMHAAGAGNTKTRTIEGAQLDFIKMLLNYGADISSVSDEGLGVLDYAIKNRYVHTAEYLLEKGAALTAQTISLTQDKERQGYNYDLTKLIFDVGAKEGLNYEEDPLLEAAILGDSEKASELLRNNDGQYNEQVPFFIASYCNTNTLKSLLDKGLDVSLRNVYGTSLLGFAAKNGNLKNVKYLVEQGAEINPNAWMRSNLSPLGLAVQQNNYEIASYLLSQGAEFYIPEDGLWNGWAIDGEGVGLPKNELEAAAMNGNIAMIELLQKYGYPFIETNVLFASNFAIINDHIDTLKYFLEHDFIRSNFINKNLGDETLLTFAVINRNLDTVDFLLEYGARTEAGALEKACESGLYEIVKHLIEKGVNEDILTVALESATDRGNFDIVKLLVENGANITEDAIRSAAQSGSHILKFFIEQGISIDSQFNYDDEDYDYTMLMVAAIWQNRFGIEVLLKAGADTALTNSKGQTALDIAKKSRNSAIIKMFKQYKK